MQFWTKHHCMPWHFFWNSKKATSTHWTKWCKQTSTNWKSESRFHRIFDAGLGVYRHFKVLRSSCSLWWSSSDCTKEVHTVHCPLPPIKNHGQAGIGCSSNPTVITESVGRKDFCHKSCCMAVAFFHKRLWLMHGFFQNQKWTPKMVWCCVTHSNGLHDHASPWSSTSFPEATVLVKRRGLTRESILCWV